MSFNLKAIIESVTLNFNTRLNDAIHHYQYSVSTCDVPAILAMLGKEFKCTYRHPSLDAVFEETSGVDLALTHQNYLVLQVGVVTIALFETHLSKAFAERLGSVRLK